MKIALLGANGPVGKRILNELLDRGHHVTAIVRDVNKVPTHPNVSAVVADVGDSRAVADAVRDHDAVISSIRFLKIDYDNLIGGIKSSGVKRYLMVGGAGSLYLPGTTTTLIEGGRIPEQYLPEPTAGKAFLKRLKQEKELDWTFLSPSEMFSNDEVYGTKPGGRTGVFRVGLDELLVDENGISEISYEDFAVAMVDELESPMHSRRRFTVGY